MKTNNYFLISGGTGGHVIPAVNFGNFLIEKGHSCYLIVDKRGRIYANSFKGKIIVISSSHFSYNFIGKLNAIISLLLGLLQSLKHFIIFRPSLCIAFGGYTSSMPLIILFFLKFLVLLKFIYMNKTLLWEK